jgi:hypothetical protein
VQHDGTNELDVEGNHVPGEVVPADIPGGTHQAAADVLHHGVDFAKDIVNGFTVGQAVPEFGGFGPQFLVGETLEFFVKDVDPVHHGAHTLDVTLALGAHKFFD